MTKLVAILPNGLHHELRDEDVRALHKLLIAQLRIRGQRQKWEEIFGLPTGETAH